MRIASRTLALLLGVLSIAWATSASAHKASDAYLQLDGGGRPTTLRIDVALRDLNVALDLDADGDGSLTWREVRTAWPQIESYLRARVALDGCPFTTASRALEKRIDGVYAALTLQSSCTPAHAPRIRYDVMAEVDPTHRGIAQVHWADQAGTLQVLVPQRPGTSAPSAATSSSFDASTQFLREGIHHIVTGYDHVLFLICLLFPAVMRRSNGVWRPVGTYREALLPVFGIVTAFTVAHSITLALAATRRIVISPAFIEPAIAVTILLAAIDNLRPIFRGKRVFVTFFFGLIHGFGFASVLAELDMPVRQFAWALFQFNLGIEIGQLVIVTTVTTLLFTLRDLRAYPAVFIRTGSMVAMVIASLWLYERIAHVAILPV